MLLKGEPIKPRFLNGSPLAEPALPPNFKEVDVRTAKTLPKPAFSRKEKFAAWIARHKLSVPEFDDRRGLPVIIRIRRRQRGREQSPVGHVRRRVCAPDTLRRLAKGVGICDLEPVMIDAPVLELTIGSRDLPKTCHACGARQRELPLTRKRRRVT